MVVNNTKVVTGKDWISTHKFLNAENNPQMKLYGLIEYQLISF